MATGFDYASSSRLDHLAVNKGNCLRPNKRLIRTNWLSLREKPEPFCPVSNPAPLTPLRPWATAIDRRSEWEQVIWIYRDLAGRTSAGQLDGFGLVGQ
ncbi:hypothetical protein GWI33_005714 [Rhynchophorus ferrugineus]|uniref:Uncharacterized protein n=1 Tax=Rhynchophorus ferrugineus TaxID=354439 RepID=A0A834IVL2_RHYFE|nr:hypothetical protein GWI33_005714 [Rhynchophorus ferrugineus]